MFIYKSFSICMNFSSLIHRVSTITYIISIFWSIRLRGHQRWDFLKSEISQKIWVFLTKLCHQIYFFSNSDLSLSFFSKRFVSNTSANNDLRLRFELRFLHVGGPEACLLHTSINVDLIKTPLNIIYIVTAGQYEYTLSILLNDTFEQF